jgi:hypothetical protein
MFTLHSHHTDAFDKDIRRRFENRMVDHLNAFFPAQCGQLGEKEVRNWINLGIQRAGSYGIVSERDVCKYIDIMFVHGRNFDSDPRKPWAASILTAKSVDPADKTRVLFENARKYAPEAEAWHA